MSDIKHPLGMSEKCHFSGPTPDLRGAQNSGGESPDLHFQPPPPPRKVSQYTLQFENHHFPSHVFLQGEQNVYRLSLVLGPS